jgi:cysteine synthase A
MPAEDLPVAEFAFPGPVRDQLVAAILAGQKTTTSGLVADYEKEGEPLPHPGLRQVVVDSAGHQVAVIETTAVRVIRLGDVDLPHALGEGEGYTSVAEWRAGHERFWHSAEMRESLGDPGFTVDDGTLIVAEAFRLVESLAPAGQVAERPAEPGGDRDARPGVLGAIGGTPLVWLNRVVAPEGARICVKLESANPTGSMKDRMAAEVIRAAAADGRLPPGGTVVEYTAGTTGISLALVCAVLGYRLHVVFSDAFSQEKRLTMHAFGAQITDVASDGGRITEKLIKEMIATSDRISRQPGHWWADQLSNHDAIRGYVGLGYEIWGQSGGRVDAFVQSVGTAHSIHGAAAALRGHSPDVAVIAVEPAESAVLSGAPTGSHRIEGIGIGFIPPLWDPAQVDGIEQVRSEDAAQMARRLASEEGIFAGTSTGANVVAALRVAERLPPAATVATIAVDSGLRYLSTVPYA